MCQLAKLQRSQASKRRQKRNKSNQEKQPKTFQSALPRALFVTLRKYPIQSNSDKPSSTGKWKLSLQFKRHQSLNITQSNVGRNSPDNQSLPEKKTYLNHHIDTKYSNMQQPLHMKFSSKMNVAQRKNPHQFTTVKWNPAYFDEHSQS